MQDVFALARALTAGYICFSFFPSGSCNCQFTVFYWLMCLKSELDDFKVCLAYKVPFKVPSQLDECHFCKACGIGFVWIFYIAKSTVISRNFFQPFPQCLQQKTVSLNMYSISLNMIHIIVSLCLHTMIFFLIIHFKL